MSRPALDDLEAVAALESRGDGVFGLEVPDGWQQGAGTSAGLVVGLLCRAAEALQAPDARQVRTASAQLGGGVVPGPAEIRTAIRRRGQGLTTCASALIQGGSVRVECLTVHGAGRGLSRATGVLGPPDRPPWESVAAAELPADAASSAHHFEYRNVGALPFEAARDARTAGWIALRARIRRHDTAELLALSDAWWPVAMCYDDGPRKMATVGLQWTRFARPRGDAPFFHEGRVLAAEEGVLTEERVLFDADGRLVCVAHHIVALG